MRGLRVTARAKINLYLGVGEILNSGYHSVSTVLQNISLADELTIEPAEGLVFSFDDPNIDSPDNLVCRAATALRERFHIDLGARLSLKKKIPIGAGLGGGSADAAAAILGLTEFWDVDVGPKTMADLAVALGADVPFCLVGGTAIAEGIGEKVRSLDPLDLGRFVIAKPMGSLSTSAVYRLHNSLDIEHKSSIAKMERAIGAGDRAGIIDLMTNDLEPAAEELLPEISLLKELADRAGAAKAMVSGSGSAVIVMPPPGTTAETLAGALAGVAETHIVTAAPKGVEIDSEY